MTLNPKQFENFYHGTATPIEGDTVEPSDGALGQGAYATRDQTTARYYAVLRASQQGKETGFVYHVSPMSDPMSDDFVDPGTMEIMDKKGLKVHKLLESPRADTEEFD